MITGFSHIQLVVSDLDASAGWYRDVLGLEQFAAGAMTAGGRYCALRHPGARFVVGLQDGLAPGAGAPMVQHLSFACSSQAEIEAWRARCAALGYDVGAVFEEAVSYNAQARDPDGFVVEFTAPKG